MRPVYWKIIDECSTSLPLWYCRQVLAAIVQWTEDNPMKYSEDSCLGRLSVIVERFLEALDVDELDDKVRGSRVRR